MSGNPRVLLVRQLLRRESRKGNGAQCPIPVTEVTHESPTRVYAFGLKVMNASLLATLMDSLVRTLLLLSLHIDLFRALTYGIPLFDRFNYP